MECEDKAVNYHGNGMYQWDTWYISDSSTGDVHAFYLQRGRPDGNRTELEVNSLGHAVSKNLLDWTELPPILPPAPKGQLGDLQSWTGSTIECAGKYYMFYTLRSSSSAYRVQCIGMAESPDLYLWTPCAENPVITPDMRWYNTEASPAIHGLVCCRDLMVVKHDRRPGWFGVFATRVVSEEIQQGAVFAGAYTEDFQRWEQTPPVFRPPDGKYSIVEMPDLYKLGEKWVLTFLQDNLYGNRDVLGNPVNTCGTVYALADALEGPYVEPENNLLLASMGYNGFSCRTVDFQGRKYVLYSRGERLLENEHKPIFGSLSTPKEVRLKGGHPRYFYAESLMESKVREKLRFSKGIPERIEHHIYYENEGRWTRRGNALQGEIGYSWCRYCFEPGMENYTLSVDITPVTCIAVGLSIRQQTDMRNEMTALCVYLDAERQCIAAAALPRFQIADMRPWKVERGRKYSLRVVNMGDYVELYVDDELALQFISYVGMQGGCAGLFLDRGQALYENVRAEIYGM